MGTKTEMAAGLRRLPVDIKADSTGGGASRRLKRRVTVSSQRLITLRDKDPLEVGKGTADFRALHSIVGWTFPEIRQEQWALLEAKCKLYL